MPFAEPIFALPDDLQAQFAEVVRHRLASAEEEAAQLRQRLSVLDDDIGKFKTFLKSFPTKTEVSQNSQVIRNFVVHNHHFSLPIDRYDKNGTHSEKILYVLRNPPKYGVGATFIGAGNVVKALKQEEPELRTEDNSILIKKFGPTLSRMASNGEVRKFLEKGTKGRIHYLSPDWFVNDEVKPEYEALIQNLDPMYSENQS